VRRLLFSFLKFIQHEDLMLGILRIEMQVVF